jgi:hypothetical protein
MGCRKRGPKHNRGLSLALASLLKWTFANTKPRHTPAPFTSVSGYLPLSHVYLVPSLLSSVFNLSYLI